MGNKGYGQYVLNCYKRLGYLCLRLTDQTAMLLFFITPYNTRSLLISQLLLYSATVWMKNCLKERYKYVEVYMNQNQPVTAFEAQKWLINSVVSCLVRVLMVCRQETSPRGSIEPKYFFEHCLYLWVTTTDYDTLHFGGGVLFDCLVWFWEGFFFCLH